MSRIAVITGGSRGLGRNTALKLAREGSGIVLTYHTRRDDADGVVAEIESAGGRAVAPGAIETDFGGGAVRDDPGLHQMIAASTAMGRAGQPDDIGEAIASLLTGRSQWITGQRIEVSGGQNL